MMRRPKDILEQLMSDVERVVDNGGVVEGMSTEPKDTISALADWVEGQKKKFNSQATTVGESNEQVAMYNQALTDIADKLRKQGEE